MKIQCTDEECRKENDQSIFNINVTVGEDRELTETISRIPPSHFVCCFCNSEAEDLIETEEGTFNG